MNLATATTVLVTGATGHLGFNTIRELLAHGYHVRAGVRDPQDADRTAALRALGVDIVRTELNDRDSLDRAMDGVEGVFHLAALTRMWARDPEREIIEPNVRGVLNTLTAAADAGVRRVVMTSSVAAIGVAAPPERPLTELQWNESPTTAYSVAKTRAERRAWEIAHDRSLDLVTLNPTSLIGPGYFRHTPSSWLVELMVRGYVRFALPAAPGWVDVRDVAQAHLLAFECPEARGRYLLSARCVSFGDFVNMLHEIDSAIPWVRWTFPAAGLRVVTGLDYLGHVLFGLDRRLTGGILDEFLGTEMHCSTAKAKRDLGWSPRPLEETLADTIAWVREMTARRC